MKWKLWLDDCRDPMYYGGTDCLWARDVEQAQYYVKMWGPPIHMYLDHDLGVPVYNHSAGISDTENVMMFLRWLSEKHLASCPDYSCHSENPVGRQNVRAFMSSWKKILDGAK